ncbi:uncharacterized protein LOC131937416 [Physella acuta]|uniref:uncharacterized protein LOC131937416 n=1 Tax=Physella acuta TaxID=109671 RepID=UPI0027DD8048|nr:uncharacterized protein LOC131937416 [Physella acuta]XP_059150801.1 uncharacterized protein LOC131937416 [Physella acuta]
MTSRMLDITLLILCACVKVALQNESPGKNENAKSTTGVGCYKCHSRNGSDVHCGDPFHPAYNMDRYHVKCEQGLDNRVGLFPAKYCVKIKGTNLNTNEELIVRSCSLTSFDNVCGPFEFENVRYSGCLMSCVRDACNLAGRLQVSLTYLLHVLLLTALSRVTGLTL